MSEVAGNIIAEIRNQGPIPLARFMELALYCPVYGYYETEGDKIGRRGDYFTSVSVGRLFGELLAFQFAEWLEAGPTGLECQETGAECHGKGHNELGARAGRGKAEGAEAGVQIVEGGAHRGELAGDILRWLRQERPGLFERLEYWILEPSERLRGWQVETLAEFGSKVRWAKELAELESPARQRPEPEESPRKGDKAHGPDPAVLRHREGRRERNSGVTPHRSRIIFANELLDAMPVHRLGWDAGGKAWFEWGVSFDGSRFTWTRMPARPALVPAASPLESVLPDGFTLEVSPTATEWWRRAANALGTGKLLTIDYGLTTEEIFVPERLEGTLRAYRHHRLSPEPLAEPGQQDLTAHVNLSAIQEAGEAAGLRTEVLVTQGQFLTAIVEKIFSGAAGFGEWTPERTRQFQTLTHPEHLGRAFRVLVQAQDGK